MLATLMQINPGAPNLVKIRQKYRAVYMKTSGCLIVPGDINSA